MKYTMKRMMALLIALLLAMPSFALAEEPVVEAVQAEGEGVVGDEADQQVEELGEISLPDDPEPQSGEELPPEDEVAAGSAVVT